MPQKGRRTRNPRAVPVVALAAVLALGAVACGESKEEKALDQVCDARADIQKNINELSSLTATTATVDGIKKNVSAIQDDLGKIKDAQPDLSPSRKQQVQAATDTFQSDVSSTVNSLS